MRPRQLRIRLALALAGLGALAAAGLMSMPQAHADGYISHTEAAYINTYGAAAICPVIDEYHSSAGVMGVMKSIMSDGFTADSAVDIINEAVSEYCPRNWPLLVAIGDAARNNTTALNGRMGGVFKA